MYRTLLQILEADAIAKVSSEGLPMEVHLSSNLRHPNIVKLRSVFFTENTVFMVLDYASGGELLAR